MTGIPVLSTLALGLTLAACMSGAAHTGGTAAGLTCVLRADRQGGSTTWIALAEASVPVTGSYDLRMIAGGATVDQGGPVTLAPGDRAELGRVTLPSGTPPGAASFGITIAGQRTACAVDHP